MGNADLHMPVGVARVHIPDTEGGPRYSLCGLRKRDGKTLICGYPVNVKGADLALRGRELGRHERQD